MSHPKRRGQRYVPEVIRQDAVCMYRQGHSSRRIAESLGVAPSTVRCWMSRERARRRQDRPPVSDDELGRLADQVDTSLAEVKRLVRDGDPRALARATYALTDAVDELLEVDW